MTTERISRGPVARIDLSALLHNFQRCRELNPGQPAMPVVKANGYGHGATKVAATLLNAGADAVCVARLDEAIALRESGITGNIVILEGVYDAEELALALHHSLTLVLHSAEQIASLPNATTDAPQQTWVKLETGMHRLGAPLTDAKMLADTLMTKQWCSSVGWLTHLACADDRTRPETAQQIDAIKALAQQYNAPISFANAAATCAGPHHGHIRPGITLYGGSPLVNTTAAELGLKPAMSLETPLLAVKEIPRGATVGYGATWQASRISTIGIAAIGYGDGYPRSLSSCDGKADATVAINGRRYPVIGRVSMDKISIDLSDQPDGIKPGDNVELWGNSVPVDEVATRAGTISYELLCNITSRVPRIYSPS